MLPDFTATVRALAETVAARERGATGTPRAASDFVLASFAGMPAYLRPPLRLATWAFDAAALPRRGRPFHRLPAEQRMRQLQAWEASALQPARMLMSFYVNLAIFGLWSGPDHDA